MPRGHKKKPRADRKPQKPSPEAALAELVSVIRCPRTAADELGALCQESFDHMDGMAGIAAAVAATWRGRPEPYGALDGIATELIAELERHADALDLLLGRLAPIVEQESEHEDLDPVEVAERLRPLLTAPADEP